jgi:hypothetical protein
VQLTATTTNVLITGSVTDARCGPGTTAPARCAIANAAAGPDYTGELQAVFSLRGTDRWSSTAPGGGNHPATGQDFSLTATFPCTSTASTSLGSTCTLNTNANALVPGLVVDVRRTIWQLGQVSIVDGGPDGVISTPAGNKVLAKQGVFAP